MNQVVLEIDLSPAKVDLVAEAQPRAQRDDDERAEVRPLPLGSKLINARSETVVENHLRDGEPFAVAGLWERWEGDRGALDTYSLLTTEANALLAEMSAYAASLLVNSPSNDGPRCVEPPTARTTNRKVYSKRGCGL